MDSFFTAIEQHWVVASILFLGIVTLIGEWRGLDK